MLNSVNLQGKIITDLELKGTEEHEFLSFLLSVTKNYKAKDAQYADSTVIPCKCFRNTAKFIHQYFKKMDNMIISGVIERDDDYTKEDGTTAKGQIYVKIDNAYFCDKKDSSDSKSATTTTSTTAAASPVKVLGGTRPVAATPKSPLGLRKPTLGK